MDIQVTYEMGGMEEFERTGVYPEYIRFYSKEYKRTWRHMLRGDSKTGKLKYNGLYIYEYNLNKKECKIREINNYGEVGAWQIMENMMILMVD